jgi:hypothetical protein
MHPHRTLVALAASLLLAAAAYGSAFLPGDPPAWASWALLLGLSGSLVAFMALGAARKGRLGVLVWPLGFVFLVLVVGFGAALVLPPVDPLDPALWFGLPVPAAIVLLGVGLLPLVVLPLAYGLTFPGAGLSREEVDAVREMAAAARGNGGGPGNGEGRGRGEVPGADEGTVPGGEASPPGQGAPPA